MSAPPNTSRPTTQKKLTKPEEKLYEKKDVGGGGGGDVECQHEAKWVTILSSHKVHHFLPPCAFVTGDEVLDPTLGVFGPQCHIEGHSRNGLNGNLLLEQNIPVL